MKKQFEILETTRQNLLSTVKGLTIDQLNEIPKGFNNNLIWNLGHIVVTQQLLCYGLSDVVMKMDNAMIAKYRKGTKPSDFIGEEEFTFIKKRLVETIEEIQKDIETGLLGKDFKIYPTSYGFTLNSLEDAIIFNNIHEAMHLGYMMALKHAL